MFFELGHVDPGLGCVDSGLGRVDPGLGRIDPGLGCVDSGLGRVDPGLGRVDSGLGLTIFHKMNPRTCYYQIVTKSLYLALSDVNYTSTWTNLLLLLEDNEVISLRSFSCFSSFSLSCCRKRQATHEIYYFLLHPTKRDK